MNTETLPTRTRRSDGEATRQRVLDAAVASILDVGYYKSSSNEIARRASVTWGVIQHQFGTREALLLEVVKHHWDRLDDQVANAVISGETLEDRLHEVLALLDPHYGQPEHLAIIQIGLDLANNPDTSAETLRALRSHTQKLGKAWQSLCADALGDFAEDPDLVQYAFSALRGYLEGNLVAANLGRTGDNLRQRQLLIEGVTAAIEGGSTRRGGRRG